jgi:alkanesulfonate monooxygenase
MSTATAILPNAAVRPTPSASGIRIFSTCPSSSQYGAGYLRKLTQVARWSEQAGCTGSLIYTDNSLADPWLVAQAVIQSTRTLCPLVAVQPVYMHPYSVAKMVSTLGYLYGRPVWLNMVAGGFKNDLTALSDSTPHDQRYQRLVEYSTIIRRLLDGGSPCTLDGEFYRVKNLTLSPALDPELRGDMLISGSSDAGLAAARQTGAIAIRYPEPPENRESLPADSGPCGVRVGIVTRPDEDEAWKVALNRFPEDRKGKITRTLASRVSDSAWHKRLSDITEEQPEKRSTYWLHPFGNYHTNCPYLVGAYENVAAELAKYIALGYQTFILDIPAAEEEFLHIAKVFESATRPTAAAHGGARQ